MSRTGQYLPLPDLAGLVAAVGLAVAKELILEGRILDAAEAATRRTVTRVVPAETLDAEAQAAARRIAAGAPAAARWHKRALEAASEGGLSAIDEDDVYRSAESAAYREGLAAFFDKREPVFGD